MKNYLWWVVLGALITAGPIYSSAQRQSQPQSAQWYMKDCFTLEDVTVFLNQLPPESAATAKVTTINSQRSFLGSMSSPYYVWYRK